MQKGKNDPIQKYSCKTKDLIYEMDELRDQNENQVRNSCQVREKSLSREPCLPKL
jgi:hypothetical protein